MRIDMNRSRMHSWAGFIGKPTECRNWAWESAFPKTAPAGLRSFNGIAVTSTGTYARGPCCCQRMSV